MILHLENLNFLSFEITHYFNFFSSSRTIINLTKIQWTCKVSISNFKISNEMNSEDSFQMLNDLIISKDL